MQQELPAEWDHFDFKLIEAFQMLNDETCPKCSQPIWLCRTDSEEFGFKVRSAVCFAERTLEADKSRREKSKPTQEQKMDWGKYYYPVPELSPTAKRKDFPTRQEFFAGKME